MILLDLIQNLALLVAMAVAYRILSSRWDDRSLRHRLAAGLLFGSIALVGMATPVRVLPGVIFDGRSIIMGVAGLVGGPLVAAVAGAMAAAYRIWIGGVGTLMGVLVIVEAGALGVALYAWRRRTGRTPGTLALWAFGLAIHGVMAALLFTLPGGARSAAWHAMGAAILLAYPLATLLVCRLFLDYEHRDRERRALEESEARFRALWTSVGDGVIVADAAGRVTLINPAAERLTGWPAAEAAGKPLPEVVRLADEQTGAPAPLPAPAALGSGEAAPLPPDGVLAARDGTRRHVGGSVAAARDTAGAVTGTVLLLHDRTAELEARRALLESRQRMALALAGAELGTWDWDVRTGAVTRNERWMEMLGYGPGEIEPSLEGRDSLIHPDDLPRVHEALHAHLAGITERYTAEYRLRHRSGRWVWVQDTGRVLERAPDGTPLRASGTHLDITDRKAAEADRAEREGRLERQNQILLGLMTDRALFSAGLKEAVARLTEAGAALLEVDRAGFWWCGSERRTVRCWDVFRDGALARGEGEEWPESRFPGRCEAPSGEEVLAVEDTRTDPRTRNALEYLDRHGIVSLLQVPVWLGDSPAGWFNFETLSARRTWSGEDERIGAVLSALLTACMESADRVRAEVELKRAVQELTRTEAELRASLKESERARRALLSTLEDRRRAEEALRESEERFRRLAENASDLIYRYRFVPEPGFDYVSPAATAMTGYTPEEHYADPELGFKLIHPEDRALLRAVAAGEIEPGKPIVLRWVHKNGSIFWTEQRNVAIHDAEGRLVAIEGIARDVTDRVLAARELERFHDTLDRTLDCVFLFEPESLRFVYVNEGAARQVGYTRDELLRMHPYDIKPEFPEERFRELIAPLLAGELPAMTFETVHRRKDGGLVPVEVSLQLVTPRGGESRFVAVVRDVSERKRRDEALRASEERYRSLFEESPQILWVYDLETLRFLAVNDAAVAHYGYSREEFLGMTLRDIHPAEDVPALPESVAGMAPGDEEAGIWRHRLKGGRVVHVEIRSHQVSHGGRPAKLVLVTDVTERLRVEEEIRALTAELEERVRKRTVELEAANAELESFSYSVSHDLKAPLRAVDGYSALLEHEATRGLGEEGRRLVREIRANAQRMGQLIEDLLAFSRVGRAAMREEAVDLGALIAELLERERHMAPGRRIEFHAAPLPRVWGDPLLLRQALDNVVANAVKFTRPREVARIEVTGRTQDGNVEITVRDNGVGFDPRYQHKLFRVFERLHYPDEFEGTGVGLAIVKRIVERHGGKVAAEGEPDRGAAIRITLPLAREEGAA